MQYGFVIDNRKCIGCHACSTACKAENEVPLGVNRTWVKYTEQGAFPDTRRHFQVTRCNHCANPPCVHICPVTAMYQRADGIVEFDPEACIGCKACIQACPYDAVYIDPESHTAAKCHFCAHRVDVGLEPACVVVCPEHAILAGDLDNPASEIAIAVAANPVRVRKPEQGTAPKLFYIESEEASIVPMLARQDTGMLWAEWPDHGEGDWRGPIHFEDGPMAGALLRAADTPRETYNVPHRIPWHWQVPAYLVAKAIGAGAFLVAAIGTATGVLPYSTLFTTVAFGIALVFTGINTALLVWDLDKPARFFSVLVRPQWKSWLARGAIILVGFSTLAGLMFAAELTGALRLSRHPAVVWPAVTLAALAAVYSAFLFAQSRGRDFWRGALVPWQMLAQSVAAGCAALLIAAPAAGASVENAGVLRQVFIAAVIVALVTVVAETNGAHRTRPAQVAAQMIVRGRYAWHFRFALVAGHVAPLILAAAADGMQALALSGALFLAGLAAYEWAFVMAPQDVPNN
jgi:Fe-S-cluster-containing dehydrogenase component/formate-dependent nitrite reductase membrane component NrfD